MPEEPEQVHMPHDKGYRHLFTSKKVFLQLIRSFVKHGWAEQIDEANLEYINRTFVLQDFKDKEADVVYRAKLKDRDVIFYVLMELQSTVDFLIPAAAALHERNLAYYPKKHAAGRSRTERFSYAGHCAHCFI